MVYEWGQLTPMALAQTLVDITQYGSVRLLGLDSQRGPVHHGD
jgi:hypothetical protein